MMRHDHGNEASWQAGKVANRNHGMIETRQQTVQ